MLRIGGFAGIVVVAALPLGACGSSTTTVVNNTTTVTAKTSDSTADETTSNEATGLTVPSNDDFAEAQLRDTYTGRCGPQGIAIGGEVGTARPGFKSLKAIEVSCPVALTAAQDFVDAWEDSCSDGCTVNAYGFMCEYEGGTEAEGVRAFVNCYSARDQVTFELAFLAD